MMADLGESDLEPTASAWISCLMKLIYYDKGSVFGQQRVLDQELGHLLIRNNGYPEFSVLDIW